MKQNLPVHKAMKALLSDIEANNEKKTLLLHSCCAPCSSVVLERLSPYFEIYDLFYNPNITIESEYEFRYNELERFVNLLPHKNEIHVIKGEYEKNLYLESVKGYEKCPERGDRCSICFELRLRKAALMCKELNCDYFATTLTLSPLKNQNVINEIGERVGKEVGVTYLKSDFKKDNGYLRSIELSNEYNLYRQNYCGCIFSKGVKKDEED